MAKWNGNGNLTGKVGKDRIKVAPGAEIPDALEKIIDQKVWNKYVESGWIDGRKKSIRSGSASGKDGE